MAAFRLCLCLLVCVALLADAQMDQSEAKKKGPKRGTKPKPNKKRSLKVRMKALEKLVRAEITEMKDRLGSCGCSEDGKTAPSNGDVSARQVTSLNSTMHQMFAEYEDRLATVVETMNQYGDKLSKLVEYQANLEERVFIQLNGSIEEMRVFTNKFAMDLSEAMTNLLSATGGQGGGIGGMEPYYQALPEA